METSTWIKVCELTNIGRLWLVKAELKCYHKPSTLEWPHVLAIRCRKTVLLERQSQEHPTGTWTLEREQFTDPSTTQTTTSTNNGTLRKRCWIGPPSDELDGTPLFIDPELYSNTE